MADLLADLTLLKAGLIKTKQTALKQITDFMLTDEYKSDEFPISTIHAKLLTLGDTKTLRDIEKGIYADKA